jgi:hypothetical protein
MAGTSLYFTNFKNQTFEFPMTPSALSFATDAGNQTVTVIELGEINRLAPKRNLGSMSITLRIPRDLTKRKRYWTGQKITWPTATGGDSYVQLLTDMHERHEVVRVVLTGTPINYQFTLEKLEKGFDTTLDEWIIDIDLIEWRDYAAKVLKVAPLPPKTKTPVVVKKPRPSGGNITVGSTVIVNGQLHRDSYGSGPGLTEVNATRKVNFTAPGRAFPYHVTLLDGGWRGWVSASAVRLA